MLHEFGNLALSSHRATSLYHNSLILVSCIRNPRKNTKCAFSVASVLWTSLLPCKFRAFWLLLMYVSHSCLIARLAFSASANKDLKFMQTTLLDTPPLVSAGGDGFTSTMLQGRKATCLIQGFILNKNKFPSNAGFQTGCPNILTSVCVLNSQFHGEMSS